MERGPKGSQGTIEGGKRGLFSRAMEVVAKAMTREFIVEGKEHIPKKGCLVIANHSSHFDGWALVAALSGQDVAGVWFDDAEKTNRYAEALLHLIDRLPISHPIRRIRPVASHISEASKETHRDEDTLMGRIIRREEDSQKRGADIRSNIGVLHRLVEDVQRGKKVVYFPEGIFFEKNEKTLRDTTRGVQAIAKLYKRATGEDLSVLPVGIAGADAVMGTDPNHFGISNILDALKQRTGKVTVRFGESFSLQSDGDLNEVFRQRVGSLLPAEYVQRREESDLA